MDNYGMTPVNELEINRGRNIRIAGFVTDVVHATTKKGSKFGKMFINDYSGHLEIVLWEKNYVQYGNYLVNGQKLMIQGVYDEHRFRPGTMEFQIQNMMLLDEVRKKLTKRLHLSIPLHKLDDIFVDFMEQNLRNHPGTTELMLHVADWDGMETKLKSQNKKIEVNDELVRYIEEHEEIKYSLDKA